MPTFAEPLRSCYGREEQKAYERNAASHEDKGEGDNRECGFHMTHKTSVYSRTAPMTPIAPKAISPQNKSSIVKRPLAIWTNATPKQNAPMNNGTNK